MLDTEQRQEILRRAADKLSKGGICKGQMVKYGGKPTPQQFCAWGVLLYELRCTIGMSHVNSYYSPNEEGEKVRTYIQTEHDLLMALDKTARELHPDLNWGQDLLGPATRLAWFNDLSWVQTEDVVEVFEKTAANL